MSFGVHVGRGRKTTRTAVLLATTALAALGSLSAAEAACTPPAVDASNPAPGTTVTCSGTTTDQNGANGYGTGVQIGIIVNVVAGATVTGSARGIHVSDAIVNNAGNISGLLTGVSAPLGAATVSVVNSGSIVGANGVTGGIVTVTNNSGGTISGTGNFGIAFDGHGYVVNSGSIDGVFFGISASLATLINNVGGNITGGEIGIGASNSSIFNAGTINGGNNAAILFDGNGNTLTLAPTSVITGDVFGAGGDTFQLGGTGAGTFDIASLSDVAQYKGFNTFNKVGSSTWTLTGTSTFDGPVNVNGGTLAVNGDITSASEVTVNAGGILGGNGTVGNTTINNGGALAPGNSIGLLTVQGSLVFAAAASYLVEVSPANSDRVNVTGAATLGGATINASFAPGAYVAKKYTILSAAGGLVGSFGSLANTNLPSGFQSSLSYDANNVYLNLALFGPSFSSGLNVNQQNVANTLINFFNTTGGIPMVFGALTPAGFTQVSGELGTGAQQATFNAMSQFMGVMTDPFIGGRGDVAASSGASSSYAEESRQRSGAERDAYGMIAKAAPGVQTFEQRWSVWGAGFGGSQTSGGDAVLGSNTATSRVYGTAVGADYRFSPFTLAGFALAGGGSNFFIANGLGSGRSDLFQAGAFVRHSVGPAYISAALAYGWQDITTDRTVTVAGIDRLRAKFNGNAWSGRVEGGYRLVTAGIGLTPYAAGQFTTFELPNYAEAVVFGANTFALAYAAKSVTASRSELGLRSDKSFAMQDAILTLRGRAAWAHDFNPDRSIAATFQTLPGASFVVNGAVQARNAALTTASAEMKWLSGVSLAATFEGEFSDVTKSYAGKGVARYTW